MFKNRSNVFGVLLNLAFLFGGCSNTDTPPSRGWNVRDIRPVGSNQLLVSYELESEATKYRLSLLNKSDLSQDTSFSQKNHGAILGIKGGDKIFIEDLESRDLILLGKDGEQDTSFHAEIVDPDAMHFLSDGSFLVSTIVSVWHMESNGETISTHSGSLGNAEFYPGAFQPDGKLIAITAAGLNDVTRKIIRVNIDGTTDSSFTPYIAPTEDFDIVSPASDITFAPDGKIYIVMSNGEDTLFVRLNPDGVQDQSFSPDPTVSGTDRLITLYRVAFQSDGKIIVSGQFFKPDSSESTCVNRLNQDGSLDKSFSSPALNSGTSGSSCTALYVDNDDRIFVGGYFDEGIVRLKSNGEIDK